MDPEQDKREAAEAYRNDQLRAAEQSLTFLRDTNQLIRRMDCYAADGDYGMAKDWLFRAVDELAKDASQHLRLATKGAADDIPF